MPLITLAVTAYAAGLLLGFGGGLFVGTLAAVATAAAGAVRRDARLLAAGALVAAGALLAVAARADQRGCRERALARTQWDAVLLADAEPGALVRASVTLGGSRTCRLPASAVVERGHARAGDAVVISGAVAPSRRGILVRAATVTPRGGAGWSLRAALVRARAGVGRRIDALFRDDAPLVRALVIADEAGLDPALRDRFAAAGLVHVLSISGLHVAIIAAAMTMLLRAARLRPTTSGVAALFGTAVYIAMIGAPAPAVRAGVMLGVAVTSRLLGRATSPWAALALGAGVPLLDPDTVLDLGYQLSVVGMAALLASGALARRLLAPAGRPARLDGVAAEAAGLLLASLVAGVVTAPFLAWHFGRLSLVAPLTNVAAAPIVAVLQPALFLALLCAPAGPVAALVADAVHPLISALDAVAAAGASVPFATIDVAPSLPVAALGGLAATAAIIACVSRFPARPAVAALASLALAAWMPASLTRPRQLEVHMIDVGQGDAIAVRTPAGRWIVVDAGRAGRAGDDGRRTVVPYVRRLGGEVATFILSHPHGDHVGGAASLFRALRPARWFDGAYLEPSEIYRGALLEAERDGVAWQRARPGDSLAVDGVRLTFLAPDSAWVRSARDANEASVVVAVRYDSVRVLLVGDAEREEEEWLLEHAPPGSLRADVLKVGHHGSSTSSSAAFLDAVDPRVALVSVGAGNSYGHPSRSVIRSLAARGVQVLRTDLDGTTVIRSDGRSLEVEAGGDRWRVR